MLQAVGGNGVEQTVVSGSMEVLRPCWAVATSGVPVREVLFNATICHHSPFNLFQYGDLVRNYGHVADPMPLEVASPIIIGRKDGHRHRKGSHGDVIFLTSRGEVSYAKLIYKFDRLYAFPSYYMMRLRRLISYKFTILEYFIFWRSVSLDQSDFVGSGDFVRTWFTWSWCYMEMAAFDRRNVV